MTTSADSSTATAASPTFADPRDSARGRDSYDSLRADIDALAESDKVSPWMSQPDASRQAWVLAQRAAEPERFERLQGLGSEFDIQTVERLHRAAWALFHTQTQFSDAGATHTEAQIPKELAEEAFALDHLLFRILDYNVGHIPEVAAKLASIRPGTSHSDTAGDLHRLAKLGSEHHEALERDGNHYDPALLSRARELSATIQQELAASRTAELAHWTNQRARVFALLARWFDEVRTTCLWLHRHEPEQAKLFPALFRTPAKKSSAKSTPAQATGPAAESEVPSGSGSE